MTSTKYKVQVVRCVLIRDMIDVVADDSSAAERIAVKQAYELPLRLIGSHFIATAAECIFTASKTPISNANASRPPLIPFTHECELESWEEPFSYALLSARVNAPSGRVIMTADIASWESEDLRDVTADWHAQIGAISANAVASDS